MTKEKEFNLDCAELTLEEAKSKYPVYPRMQLIPNSLPLDMLTYVETDNGYLVPIRLELENESRITLQEISVFLLDIDELIKHTKEDFNGFSIFGDKSNYIYADGIVISIFKIKK